LPERVCVLASGGLDSAVLLGTLARRREVHPVYVRCGLRWERAEEALLGSFLRALRGRQGLTVAPLVRLELPIAPLYGGNHWSVSGRGVPGARAALASNYLPGRNLLLASLAAVHCARMRIPELALALLADNPFPDATPAFLAALGRVASQALGQPIVVRAPFRRLAKEAVIQRGRDLPLALTLSCASPRGLRHCGQCTKCAERQRAFARSGVLDPTTYVATPVARGLAARDTARARKAREQRTGPRN
jgi:7-cyano-7-deazaguanine synthase